MPTIQTTNCFRSFSLLTSAQMQGKTDLKRFLALHPEYKSPSTKHDAAGAIVTAFRWAEDEGIVIPCPYRRPRDLPAMQPRAAIRHEEVRAVLLIAKTKSRGKSGPRFRLALWFLAETGIRTCELYKLDWEQYDPERGVFELPSKSTRKTGQLRLIVLSRRAWRLIEWIRRSRPSGPVFLNGRGRAWNKGSFGDLFRRYGDLAGVRKSVSAYCCRHSFCCRALEAGAGERQLADYMGQSSTRYVAWYSRSIRQKVEYLRAVGERAANRAPGPK